MAREIKFRGIRVDYGDWVYGNLFYWIKRGVRIPIIGEGVQNGSVQGFEVDPETIGQFTGVRDDAGNEIYEGDTIKSGGKVAAVTYGHWDGGYYDTIVFGYATVPGIGPIDCGEVIGNIHQNPELLG